MKAPPPALEAPELGRLVELRKSIRLRKNIQWTRQRWEGMQSHLVAGSYVKYVSDEGDAFGAAPYGPNYGRLVRLKNKCESTDFFRMNHKQANQNGKSGELIKRCCRLTRKVLR
jgi:Berberine and berberine like